MKRLAIFAASFGAALVLFVTAAFLCVALTLFGDGFGNQSTDGAQSDASGGVSGKTAENLEVLVIYSDADDLFASVLTIAPETSAVSAETLRLDSAQGQRAVAALQTGGWGEFSKAAARLSDREFQNYIILDSKNFIKIADRYGGLVYNEHGGTEVLLTGGQAVSILGADEFTDFCVQVAESAWDEDIFDLFGFIADNTVNDLRYPAFYDALNP